MVVSHLFSPLRSLKSKKKGRGGARRPSDSSSNGDEAWWSGDEAAATTPKGGVSAADSRMSTGLCLCCGNNVSYPGVVACFKCTVCDTINDLREVARTEKAMENGEPVVRPRVPPPPLTLSRLRAGVQAYRKRPEKHSLLEAMIRESFGNWDVLNLSFPNGKSVEADESGIALAEVHAAYKTILALPPQFIRAMMNGIEQLLRRPGRPLERREDIRYLLIIIENPLLLQQSFPQESSYHHHLVKSIIGSLANLPNRTHYSLVLWLSQQSRSSLKRKVQLVNQFISYRVQKYDRAKRRNEASSNGLQRGAAGPLTSYTTQSTQRELPAFQRCRSNTSANPRPFGAVLPDAQRGPGEGTKHSRMRSNTDSRVSLSLRSHSAESETRGPGPTPATAVPDETACELPPTNPFSSRIGAEDPLETEVLDPRSGLGIANLNIRETSTRFASLGSSLATTPADAPVEDPSRRTSRFVPLRSDNPRCPEPPSYAVPFRPSRARAASLSASSNSTPCALEPAGEQEARPTPDAVRPTRDSVMGVLDGTAEPSSPVGSTHALNGRISRTRARSSSEAPRRRHRLLRPPLPQLQMRRANNDEVLVSAEPSSTQTMGDWGAGVDFDDYYVGADGVFYPKTNTLVMHQHDWRLTTAAKVMALLHAANLLLPPRSRLPIESFYNSAIDRMDLIADYDAWQACVQAAFSFCQYPFLLSLQAKVQIMQVDAARQMDSKLKEAVLSALFQTHLARTTAAQQQQQQPHLKLLIRRRCLVEDSLHQLATHEQDLKKRLKIEFVGEEGIDAGGLAKEWFMLLLRDLMNPLYGMFTREADDDGQWSEAYWFNPASLETSNQYFLVGVVVGLALYNSTILDLHLPLAVFKKLLRTNFYQASASGMSIAQSAEAPVAIVSGNQVLPRCAAAMGNGRIASPAASSQQTTKPAAYRPPRYGPPAGSGGASAPEGRSPVYGLLSPSQQLRYQINEMLADVAQFRPQLARGLRHLLQHREGDVEDVFCLSFEASYGAYGDVVTVPLVPNGANIPVTSANRVEYVMRYLQWVLNDSIAKQFEPFRRGFYYVCGSNALSLFKPEEIELMVHGSGEDWDPRELQKITEYVNFGQDADSTIVKWFWEVLCEMSADDRRLFLAFVTGSDRMPTVASSRLKMKLVLLGDEYQRFPIAHTCFNQLGLWMYRGKEELRHKLMVAIKESEGFGLK
ncbi:putative E3 ubiquitin-protein ligase [Coemansia sp. RSA 552]|nr:putative E3 ubiquitin-protein ligase [Coemansia sp. RSA 552]